TLFPPVITTDVDAVPTSAMTSTSFEIPGFRIVKTFGVVNGLTVRSRNICMFIVSGLSLCCGGKSNLWANMCQQARSDAYLEMLCRAHELGANAVIGF